MLVHAGSSGVGCGRAAMRGRRAPCLVTGRAEKLALARLGAAGAGAPRRPVGRDDPQAATRAGSADGRVDVVLDCVGAAYAAANLEALRVDGRWVLYSLLSGGALPDEVASSLLPTLMKKRVQLTATTLRGRPAPYKAALVERFAAEALPLLVDDDAVDAAADGAQRLRVVVDRTFVGLAALQDAHDHMESNASAGKMYRAGREPRAGDPRRWASIFCFGRGGETVARNARELGVGEQQAHGSKRPTARKSRRYRGRTWEGRAAL